MAGALDVLRASIVSNRVPTLTALTVFLQQHTNLTALAATPQPTIFVGQVVDKATKEAVTNANAVVRLEGKEVSLAPFGYFHIPLSSSGGTLEVVADGYRAYRQLVSASIPAKTVELEK